MKKSIIIILVLFSFNNVIFAQDDIKQFNIVDITSGEKKILRTEYYISNSKLKLVLPNEVFFEISGFRDIDTIICYYDRFIRVDYRFGGGSGVSEHYSKIFCVNNNRIYESFAALINYKSYTPKGKLDESYFLNFSITESNKSYNIEAFEKSYSKEIKKDNYKEKVKIAFSQDDCIFYGAKEYIDNFTECDSYSKLKAKYVYVNKLHNLKYIKCDDFWYTEGNSKCYFKL